MTASNGAGAAMAGSASDKLRLPPPARRHADCLADLMAEGCPSLADAADRMKRPLDEVEALWSSICCALGWQAR